MPDEYVSEWIPATDDPSHFRMVLAEYWKTNPRGFRGEPLQRIYQSEYDQEVPAGVDNPYWDIIRLMPATPSYGRGRLEPVAFSMDCPVQREDLVKRFAWSIPSPGDVSWIVGHLNGRGVVEIGAGAGYWAWQLAQAGVDVVAYDPFPVLNNKYTSAREPWFPVQWGDPAQVKHHQDRALMLCWPSYDSPWGAHALSMYEGELLVYMGEGQGGCTADDAFFEALEGGWECVGASPHHVTFQGIHCRLEIYRR